MSKEIYKNPLSREEEVTDLVLEGDADISFAEEALCLNTDEEAVLWCEKACPSDVRIDWEFRPLKDSGAAMLHFAAKNTGVINEFILSYYVRNTPGERSFHTCKLYKNSMENLVYTSADPMAGGGEGSWYYMSVVKRGKDVFFGINNLEVMHYHDDGISFGDLLTGGIIGFGQSSGTCAMYRNFKVTWI
jgi:hypothetical protein